tara:strand:+ start:148 stop:1062 length:915 start_codon:yes stop_codon:yes gene_type:complete
MKLLITGGLGHIGSYVLKRIVSLKIIDKIYVVDNISNQRYNVLFKLSNKKIEFIYGDLSKEETIKIIPKANITLHLASKTNAEESFENKKEIVKNNLGAFKNIVSYCKKNNSKLIHISSTSIYDPTNNFITELEKPNPQSPYAEIKLKEENILKKSKNIKFITLRFATISGYSDGMRFHTVVNKFCFNSVMNIPIPIWGSALNLVRPYLSLKDAYKVITYLIKKNYFDNSFYNVLSENRTLKEILKIIKKYSFNTKIKFIKSKILQRASFKTSKRKIQSLGINLNSKIENDIRETLHKIKLRKL